MQKTQGTRAWSLGREDPLEEEMTTHSSPEKSHGQRTLVGYNPQGCKELTDHALMHMCFGLNVCASPQIHMKVTVLITQLSLTLWDHQAPLSMEFSRHEYWSGGADSFFRGLTWPRDWTWVSCIAGRFFIVWATKKARNAYDETLIPHVMVFEGRTFRTP